MKKYENITQYLELLKGDEYGAWVYDDITPNASKEPFVTYTDTVKGLIEEVKKTRGRPKKQVIDETMTIKNDKEFHTPLSIQYLFTKKRPKK